MPPRRLDFVGHSDFAATGDEFLAHFVELGGLQPGERVLDVGCGIGRMARPLAGYLSPTASYDGFDVNRDGIAWCRRRYRRHPNFRFERRRPLQRRATTRAARSAPTSTASPTTTRASTSCVATSRVHAPARGRGRRTTSPSRRACSRPAGGCSRRSSCSTTQSRARSPAARAALPFLDADAARRGRRRGRSPRRRSPTTTTGSCEALRATGCSSSRCTRGRGAGDDEPVSFQDIVVAACVRSTSCTRARRASICCCADRRRARRPRAGVVGRRRCWTALDGDRPAGDPADPHPPRPRRRDRRAGAALAGRRGLGARARRAAPGRPRRSWSPAPSALYGDDMDRAVGRGRAGARGTLRVLDGRRARSTASASSTRRATPRTTSPTCTRRRGTAFTGDVAGVRDRRRAGARRRRRRPTSTSRPGARSIDARARRGSPSALALTHFGAHDPAGHLDACARALRQWADKARELRPGRASSAWRTRARCTGERELPRGHAARARCTAGLSGTGPSAISSDSV